MTSFDLDLSTPHGRRAMENAAIVAHQANLYYCKALGDDSMPAWSAAPEWQTISCLSGVEQIIKDPSTTPEQSHESWKKAKEADGWRFDPTKNAEAKLHPCMLPYKELPPEQRAKDAIFGAVVREVLHCYDTRVMVPEEAKLLEYTTPYATQDKDKQHGLVLQVGRINRVAFRAVTAYLEATGYPVPSNIAAHVHGLAEMGLFCMSAKDVEQAYDWHRINQFPALLPDFPGAKNNGAPAAYHQLERLRVMWHLTFGIAKALMWIEGIEFKQLSKITTKTWAYVAQRPSEGAWADAREQVIDIETKMAIKEDVEIESSKR